MTLSSRIQKFFTKLRIDTCPMLMILGHHRMVTINKPLGPHSNWHFNGPAFCTHCPYGHDTKDMGFLDAKGGNNAYRVTRRSTPNLRFPKN